MLRRVAPAVDELSHFEGLPESTSREISRHPGRRSAASVDERAGDNESGRSSFYCGKQFSML
jgi:hypothetical protein